MQATAAAAAAFAAAAAQATARNGRELPSQRSAGEGTAVAALRAQEEAEDEARAAADAAWSMFEKARALESRCSERGRADAGCGGVAGDASCVGPSASQVTGGARGIGGIGGRGAASAAPPANSSKRREPGEIVDFADSLPRKRPKKLSSHAVGVAGPSSFVARSARTRDDGGQSWSQAGGAFSMPALYDAWNPEEAQREEAQKTEAELRVTAAAIYRLPSVQPGGGTPSGKRTPPASSATVPPSGSKGGDDTISRLLSGNFGGLLNPNASNHPARSGGGDGGSTQAAHAPPSMAKTAVAAVNRPRPPSLAELREREKRAADAVRRLHAAAAMDIASPASKARLRVLPIVGPTVTLATMAVPLLRANVLGALRRLLQTTSDSKITRDIAEKTRMRLSIFSMLKALAPSVQPVHLRQSRGLGRLLMLIATSTAGEPRQIREAAAALLQKIVKPEAEGAATAHSMPPPPPKRQPA